MSHKYTSFKLMSRSVHSWIKQTTHE